MAASLPLRSRDYPMWTARALRRHEATRIGVSASKPVAGETGVCDTQHTTDRECIRSELRLVMAITPVNVRALANRLREGKTVLRPQSTLIRANVDHHPWGFREHENSTSPVPTRNYCLAKARPALKEWRSMQTSVNLERYSSVHHQRRACNVRSLVRR